MCRRPAFTHGLSGKTTSSTLRRCCSSRGGGGREERSGPDQQHGEKLQRVAWLRVVQREQQQQAQGNGGRHRPGKRAKAGPAAAAPREQTREGEQEVGKVQRGVSGGEGSLAWRSWELPPSIGDGHQFDARAKHHVEYARDWQGGVVADGTGAYAPEGKLVEAVVNGPPGSRLVVIVVAQQVGSTR